MAVETLEIKLFARPHGEDDLSWLVLISVNEQAIRGSVKLKHPFNEEQRSDCRWYVEDFICKSPYSVTRAHNTANSLQQYAKSLLDQLGLVQLVKDDFARHGKRRVTISISEDEGAQHTVHQLHWELLENRSFWDTPGDIVVLATVKRLVTSKANGKTAESVPDSLTLDEEHSSARSRVNGLLVVARDLSQDSKTLDDISPQLALGVLGNIQEELRRNKSRDCLHLEVVRPGSLHALGKHLKQTTDIHGKNYYHFVHFDVHGKVKSNEVAGYLLFNNPFLDDDTMVEENAKTVADILAQHGVQIAVLNACESARANCGDAANIAKTFVQSGVQNVLAMSFRVSSSAAELVLRAFYHSLFLKANTFSYAARSAREVLRLYPKRKARLGLKRSVADYFVPVVYSCGQDSRFIQLRTSHGVLDTDSFALKAAQFAGKDEKQLVGREFDLLRLEEKLLAQGRVHLTGRAGVGKTALLRQASSIWQQTSFIDVVLYIDFTKVRTLGDAVGSLVSQIPVKSKLARLALKWKVKAMITSETFDSAKFAEVLFGGCSKPRLMIIFDGLHVITLAYSKADRPSRKAVPKLKRFMKALLSLGDAGTPHNAIYHIFVSRLGPPRTSRFLEIVPEGLSWTKNLFILPSLRLSDSIELSLSALRDVGLDVDNWAEADLNELEMLVGLLDGNPSAILHVLPQMSQTGMSSREFRVHVQNGGYLAHSYAGHGVEDLSKEINNLFHLLHEEARDFLVLLCTFWHEGIGVDGLSKWTLSQHVGTLALYAKVINSTVITLDYRGLIEVAWPVSSSADDDSFVTWIHPLLTICGRRFANEALTGKRRPSVGAVVMLSTIRQFDETILSDELQLLCRNFKRWFLQSVSVWDLSRVLATSDAAGLDSQDLRTAWSSGAGNLGSCLSICSQQPYLPIDQWPLEYFQRFMAFMVAVGSHAQVADYAKTFERLFEIFITFNGSLAIPPVYQGYALAMVTSLTEIYYRIEQDPAKYKKYLDMGNKILKESEVRFVTIEDSPVLCLKQTQLGQNFRHLAQFGPREQAVEVWKTILDIDKTMVENLHDSPCPQRTPQQIQAVASELEADAEASSMGYSGLVWMLKAGCTYRKKSLNGMSAILDALDKKDEVGVDAEATRKLQRKLQAFTAKAVYGRERMFEGAEAMGFRGLDQIERWNPRGDEAEHIISTFDNLDGILTDLEIATSRGNSAEAAKCLSVLYVEAIKSGELDVAEECFTALKRYSGQISLQREGQPLDWEIETERVTLFTTTMSTLLANSTKGTVGMSDRIQLGTESFGRMIRLLKERDAPREDIEWFEVWRETWRNMTKDSDAIGGWTQTLGDYQKCSRLILGKMGDEEFMQKLPKHNLQSQQHLHAILEADMKDDSKLALERLEAFKEFCRQPGNEIYEEGVVPCIDALVLHHENVLRMI